MKKRCHSLKLFLNSIFAAFFGYYINKNYLQKYFLLLMLSMLFVALFHHFTCSLPLSSLKIHLPLLFHWYRYNSGSRLNKIINKRNDDHICFRNYLPLFHLEAAENAQQWPLSHISLGSNMKRSSSASSLSCPAPNRTKLNSKPLSQFSSYQLPSF